MSKKHYVVWKGVKTGVFDNWSETKAQIDGRSDAQYMGFPSKEEADQAFASTYTRALMKRSLAKEGPTGSGVKPKATRPAGASKSILSTPPQIADLNIYCDGACSPNPGKSGTGMAVYEKDKLAQLWYGLYEANGTNNSAELNGLLVAFRFAASHIEQGKTVQVLSDSRYSIDCITKWAKGWKNKGWKRGKNEEIKNLAIIQQCFSLYEQLKSNLIINHVKGHANIEGNELSDRMAVLARSQQEPKLVQYTASINVADILAMPSG